MTDYTAIYEAAESLCALLRSELTPEPVAKKENIGLCEPQSPEDFQLTVWIYNVEMIKDSGVHTGYQPDPDNPGEERFAPMQIKLHALVSAHSKAPALQKFADEYRILGKALQVVRDCPSIPTEHLVGTLCEQTEPVLLEIMKLNGEELSRIWNNSSKSIRPSFAVDISQIYIKSNRVRKAAPRITTAKFDTGTTTNKKGK